VHPPIPNRQPKHPVKFRPPVPEGLISSIGAKWGDSSAWGKGNHFHGDKYIPPAVPDPHPGSQANLGNPIVLPAPSTLPIQYGTPNAQPENSHSLSHSTQLSSIGADAFDLNPPIPSGEITNYGAPQPISAPGTAYNAPLDQPPPPPPVTSQSYLPPQPLLSVPSTAPATDFQAPALQNSYTAPGVEYNAPAQQPQPTYTAPSSPGQSSFHAPQPTYTAPSTDIHAPAPQPQPTYTAPSSPGLTTIPIQGQHGAYQLQIQSSNGNDGVPHHEVLSNGLLQDILAAIENPQNGGSHQQSQNQYGGDGGSADIGLQVLNQLKFGPDTQLQQSNSIQLPTQYGSDLTHAASNNVAVAVDSFANTKDVVEIPHRGPRGSNYNESSTTTAATTEATTTTVANVTLPHENFAQFVDQNKVAVYFNNIDKSQSSQSNEIETSTIRHQSIPEAINAILDLDTKNYS